MRSAIGFDQKRGDQVEIVNLRFAELPQNLAAAPKGWLGIPEFTKDDILRGIEMLVMGLLGLMVLFFVIRPLVRRIITPDEPPAGAVLPDGSMIGIAGVSPCGATHPPPAVPMSRSSATTRTWRSPITPRR